MVWSSEEGSCGVGEGGVFEAAAGDFEVDLGGGEVGVAEEALDFGEGGAGVETGAVGYSKASSALRLRVQCCIG